MRKIKAYLFTIKEATEIIQSYSDEIIYLELVGNGFAGYNLKQKQIFSLDKIDALMADYLKCKSCEHVSIFDEEEDKVCMVVINTNFKEVTLNA